MHGQGFIAAISMKVGGNLRIIFARCSCVYLPFNMSGIGRVRFLSSPFSCPDCIEKPSRLDFPTIAIVAREIGNVLQAKVWPSNSRLPILMCCGYNFLSRPTRLTRRKERAEMRLALFGAVVGQVSYRDDSTRVCLLPAPQHTLGPSQRLRASMYAYAFALGTSFSAA
jgi:hypothetical protein